MLDPIIAANTDDQAAMVLNMLQAAGVPTQGAVLSAAEHAALDAIINSLKAGLDHIGIEVATAGVATPEPATAAPALASA